MQAYLALLVAMLSIQGGASLAKHIFSELGPTGVTFYRLTFAALILALIWRPWKTKLSKKEKRTIFLYGAALGIMNFFFYLSLARIPLGIAVGLEFSGPLVVAVLSSGRKLDFLWVALAAIGIYLILPLHQNDVPLDPLGILYALIAGACWGLYIIFGQKAGAKSHAGAVTSLGMCVAALVIAPIGIYSAGKRLLTFSAIPMAIGVAILSSAIPYSFEMIALKKLRRQTFGILMSLEPVIASLMGYLFLNESLSAKQMLAIGFIILASAGTSVFQKSQSVSIP